MKMAGHFILVVLVLVGASIAWTTLGMTLSMRTSSARYSLTDDVAELWGSPHTQFPPQANVVWTEKVQELEKIYDTDTRRNIEKTKVVDKEVKQALNPDSSKIDVFLARDERRRGLLWFPLYDVAFDGVYRFTNTTNHTGKLELNLPFPTEDGIYDDFRFVVNEVDRAGQGAHGAASWTMPIKPGQVVEVAVGYRSRGMDTWIYKPADSVESVENFGLNMHTDFAAIDFPAGTMSPSSRTRTSDGWTLQWVFDRVVTGHGIGMEFPVRTQPGELAEQLSYSSPVSLGLFFVVITALTIRHKRSLHVVHYAFIAAAFYAFPLLLAYLVDHISLQWAFGISGVTSMFLVMTYLRLVVSNSFAFGPAFIAQGLYQIGFGLAHFWTGYTGLAVTVLGIATLFFLMQVTGRTDWSAVFSSNEAKTGGSEVPAAT